MPNSSHLIDILNMSHHNAWTVYALLKHYAEGQSDIDLKRAFDIAPGKLVVDATLKNNIHNIYQKRSNGIHQIKDATESRFDFHKPFEKKCFGASVIFDHKTQLPIIRTCVNTSTWDGASFTSCVETVDYDYISGQAITV